jgi:phenylalanyl-tRNA synthetase alpha chain
VIQKGLFVLETEKIAESLSEIEIKSLQALEEKKQFELEEIAKKSGLKIDSVRRAINWLKEKGLVELEENVKKEIQPSPTGKSSINKALPERLFIESLQALGGKASLQEIKKSSLINAPELNVAMGIAKRNAWISIQKKENDIMLELTGLEKQLTEKKYALENALKKIVERKTLEKEELPLVKELKNRGLVIENVIVQRKARIKEEGIKAIENAGKTKKRAYDIYGEVPKIFIGKKQPYIQFLNNIREKLVALGFKEMPERLINQEFYNFDVLFQPQNHPARTWTDTYQLKKPRFGKLNEKSKVHAIKKAHENGGKADSTGWNYNWSEEIASKLMPTAHGTAADARQMVEGVESPRKYFVINRCFRPDVLDATHLIEFNQLDGFIVGEGLNFRNLLGILKEFALEIAGAEKVKFYPDYYPFTEPSVQLSALHPKMGWIEFAGAGIFRPEITENLGIKEPVLAWGMGVDRLAMFKLGINDIRHLFSDNLDWLRKSKMVIE